MSSSLTPVNPNTPSENPSTTAVASSNTTTPSVSVNTSSSPINTSSVTSPTHATGSHFGITPSGIRLTLISLHSVDWPSDLTLDLGKSNWMEWSRKLSLVALCSGIDPWLDGSLACPDQPAAPEANYIWKRNDGALRGFIQTHISPSDLHLIELLPTSHLMFEKLRSLHEQQGPFAQLNLLLKGLQVDFTYDTSLRDTLSELRSFWHRIIAMGPLTDDDIFSILLMNGLSKHFGPLQYSIHSLSRTPNFSSETIATRILDEDSLIRRRVETGQPANPYTLSPIVPTSAAFSAVSSRPRLPRPVCAKCKRDTHFTDYCIAPGGKMGGRTVEEAKAAYRAARPSTFTHRTHNSAHVASSVPVPTTSSTSSISSTPPVPVTSPAGSVFVNGLHYIHDPSWSSSAPDSAHITEIDPSSDSNFYPYHAFFVSCNTDLAPSTALSASSQSLFSSITPSASSLPFIIDTGATCHISPFLSVFGSVHPISPHPIKGLGTQAINAVGVGTIELQTPSGLLLLRDAFFVPDSTVRLISIFLLGDAN